LTDAKLLPGLEERFAELRGGRLRYFVGGEGPALLLVHGLGGAASNWVELAPALARRARVLVPDLPGHGGSPPLPATPSLDAFADRLALLAEREALGPAIVVGHSLGGVVALCLARRRPEQVRALVLVSAAGIWTTGRRAKLVISIAVRVRPGALIAPFREWIARSPLLRAAAFWPWAVSDPRCLSQRAVLGLLAGPARHTDVGSAAAALVAYDPRPDLGAVRCPTLVLAGARDPQLPLADAHEYARRLGADLRVIADCGHLPIVERPDACLDAMSAFLERLG
jgi:pimeloyl-ACP methyl ester carboxylesterase